jgi:methylmalonyl-CoA mutase N-terminal domain/subunit
MDEALARPSEKAATLALRTQQVLAHESGVTNTVDPLGGSYFVEALTNEMEAEARAYLRRIDDLGGAVAAIESGYMQREIAESAYRYQREIDAKQRIIVGVNAHQSDEPIEIPILRHDPEGEARQRERLRRLRAERDGSEVSRALSVLDATCRRGENVMPPLLDAVNAYATLGEICGVMRRVFGLYAEPAVI